MKNLLQYVGFRHLKLRPSRSILTTLGVAFGIALYVSIAIINQSTRESFRENIESVSGKAKLTVSAGPTGFLEDRLEIVKKIEGVLHAVPMIEERAFFKGSKGLDQSLTVLGVDLLQESSIRTYKATDQKIIDDPLVFLNQADSIILTKEFAEKRNLKIDSKVDLATTQGTKTFTVRGLLEPEGPAKAFGGALLLMDIDGVRASFGKEGKLDRIDIVPEDSVDTDVLKSRISKVLGPGFSVERPETNSGNQERMIESYQRMLTFFSSLALLVGLFMVLNSVSISVTERRREIGILRALGAEKNSIVSLFIGESALLGLVGSLLGCGLGKLLSHAMVDQVTMAIASQYHTRIQVNRLEITWEQIGWTVLLGFGTSVFAAFWPAYQATRVRPLEAMKSRGMDSNEKSEKESNRFFILGGVLLVFVVLSMTLQWNTYWKPIETLNQASSVLGTVLFGPTIVFLLIKGLKKISSRTQGTIVRLSQDNLLRSRKRTGSNITALMVGLFLVMLVATVRNSFHVTSMTWISEILTADLIVSGNGRLITADVQSLDEDLQSKLLEIPGIVIPEKGQGTRSKILPYETGGVRYAIKTFDEPVKNAGYRNLAIQGDHKTEVAEKLFHSTEPRIIVSENYFVKNPNLKIGDKISLSTPGGLVDFEIIGKCIDFASANGVFYMNRAVYRDLWHDKLVTAFSLHVLPGVDPEAVRSEIDRRFGRELNLVVLSNRDMRDAMAQAIDQSFAFTKAIEFAALLVALLGLLNTLLISVMERTREIGILRAIGTSKKQVSRMILSEAVIQGTLGAVVASFFGSFIGKLWIEHSLAQSLGWMVDFHFPYRSVVFTIAVGTVVAALAGVIPARRASEIPIVEALDYE